MQFTDTELQEFINRLDKSTVEVSDWEASFIQNTMNLRSFSPKQREVILKLIAKYGVKLKF